MKSKKIWIWAVVFGLLASGTLYMNLFAQQSQETSLQQTEDINPETSTSGDGDQETQEMNAEQSDEESSGQQMLPLEEGKRAISIELTEVEGVSGFIKPGDYVDLVTIMQPSEEVENSDDHLAATLLLQMVRVLAVGHGAHSPEEAAYYAKVTLEVDPYEGLALGLATKDDLYVMLRDPDDTSIEPDRTHIHEEDLHEGVFR